jgi:hypothetical protein
VIPLARDQTDNAALRASWEAAATTRMESGAASSSAPTWGPVVRTVSAYLVVCQGGHGTVSRALLHGAPLLVIPLARDQTDNAHGRAEGLGGGTEARLRQDPAGGRRDLGLARPGGQGARAVTAPSAGRSCTARRCW